ncbi:hypothetical protein KG090_00510 [Carnobacteriaceae bacterium zg-ZUI240]|nr:hypothetical protein [Carnobacteriaceae bacterium zg-ZUI240]
MKRKQIEQEVKQLQKELEICLDVLEELLHAKTYYALRKKAFYDEKVKILKEKIEKLSTS